MAARVEDGDAAADDVVVGGGGPQPNPLPDGDAAPLEANTHALHRLQRRQQVGLIANLGVDRGLVAPLGESAGRAPEPCAVFVLGKPQEVVLPVLGVRVLAEVDTDTVGGHRVSVGSPWGSDKSGHLRAATL